MFSQAKHESKLLFFFNNTIINEKEKLGVERRRVWSRVKVEWLKVGADFICTGSGEMKKKSDMIGSCYLLQS